MKTLLLILLVLCARSVYGETKPRKQKAHKTHSAQMHDDGIVMPYTPPKEHAKYVAALDKSLLPTLQAQPDKLEEWQDDKFGVFMHWDPSCQITGAMSWSRKGRRPHHPSDGTVTRGIPTEVYNNQYKTFNPVKFSADQWARMVKDSGARYLVLTAKQHNGFCMFESSVTDYDIMASPFKRDICAELAAACQKHGVKIYWYYSQPDWTEPMYRAEHPSKAFDRFVDEFLYPQLRELVTKYGRIDGIWFDGLGKHPDTWRSAEMLKMLRDIQPHLIVNHRLAPRQWRMGDFDGPENTIGRFQINHPWETCTKIGGGWGYSGDSRPHNIANAVGLLVRCAGNGGNLLLNTGPAPDGTINPRHVERYLQMGSWLKQYGESIYATRGGPYTPGPWGCSTRSKDGNTLYLHVLGTWAGVLTLPDLPAKVVNSRVLTGGFAHITQKDGRLTITLDNFNKAKPHTIVHEYDTIIALELDRKAMDLPVISSVGESLTIGADVKASSCGSSRNVMTKAEAVVATDATDFDEGNFIRAVWRADGKDEKPWLEISLKKASPVDQVQIQEGRYGSDSTVKSFTISLRADGKWIDVYEGKGIGGAFGLVLPEPVMSDAVRIEFNESSKAVTLNAVNVYSSSGVENK